MKREARIALVDTLKQGAAVVIIFRGGWIDGITVKKGLARLERTGGLEELEGWLEDSQYFKELHGFSMGKGLLQAIGEAGAREFKAWSAERGMEILSAGTGNARQAEVIIGALRENF